MDFESSRGFETGETMLIWVDRSAWSIWLDRIKQRRWDVPTREQVVYKVTATYTA